eukprot:2875378-Prymnesium_polylepis.1
MAPLPSSPDDVGFAVAEAGSGAIAGAIAGGMAGSLFAWLLVLRVRRVCCRVVVVQTAMQSAPDGHVQSRHAFVSTSLGHDRSQLPSILRLRLENYTRSPRPRARLGVRPVVQTAKQAASVRV